MLHLASELFFNLGLDIPFGSRKKKTGPQLESVAAPGCIDLQATCSHRWFVHCWGRIQKCHFKGANDDHQAFKSLRRFDPLKHHLKMAVLFQPQDVRVANGAWCGADLVLVASPMGIWKPHGAAMGSRNLLESPGHVAMLINLSQKDKINVIFSGQFLFCLQVFFRLTWCP